MATPEKTIKLKRIRDGKIVILWARHGMSTEALSEKFKLSQRRIEQILYANHNFVEFNKDWEKKKRIARLQKWLNSAKAPEANALSLQQEIRNELEGELSSSKNETKVIIIRESNGNQNQSRDVPRQVSVQRV